MIDITVKPLTRIGSTTERMAARTQISNLEIPEAVRRELGFYFRRNGYVRRQNTEKLADLGYMGYKKGDEVRLTALDAQELKIIRALLKEAGFRPGRPFLKGRFKRLPIYGRDSVRRFLELVGESE